MVWIGVCVTHLPVLTVISGRFCEIVVHFYVLHLLVCSSKLSVLHAVGVVREWTRPQRTGLARSRIPAATKRAPRIVAGYK